MWDDRPRYTGGSNRARYSHGTITFHDWDASLSRHGSTLRLRSETDDLVFHQLPHDLEPPPPNKPPTR